MLREGCARHWPNAKKQNSWSVVLQGLKKCDVPAADVIKWCAAMLDNDRVKFIARKQLEALRDGSGS